MFANWVIEIYNTFLYSYVNGCQNELWPSLLYAVLI
jgi:hypothetical protein